jgi:hypothetical protein
LERFDPGSFEHRRSLRKTHGPEQREQSFGLQPILLAHRHTFGITLIRRPSWSKRTSPSISE